MLVAIRPVQVVPVPFSLRSEESIRAAIGRSNVIINLIGEHARPVVLPVLACPPFLAAFNSSATGAATGLKGQSLFCSGLLTMERRPELDTLLMWRACWE